MIYISWGNISNKKLALSVRFRQVPSLKLTVHTWKWVPKKGLSSSNNWIFRGYDNFRAVTPPKFDIFAPEKWYKWWLEDDLASYWVPVGNFSGAIHPGKLTWNLNITRLKRKRHLPNLHFKVPCEKLQGLYYILNFHFRAGWHPPATTCWSNHYPKFWPRNSPVKTEPWNPGGLGPWKNRIFSTTFRLATETHAGFVGRMDVDWPCSMPHDAHGAWDDGKNLPTWMA